MQSSHCRHSSHFGRQFRSQRMRPPGLAKTATGAPLRTAFIFFPNGAIPKAWQPHGEGTEFQFNATLEPLADLKSHIQVMRGLDHHNATAGKDGGGDHARGNGVFLTGRACAKAIPISRRASRLIRLSPTRWERETRFPSLELTCDASSANCGLRLGVFLRLPIQHFLEFADDSRCGGE